MAAVSELFDDTRLLVPCNSRANGTGEIALQGHCLSVVPLGARRGTGFFSKLSFVPWMLLNCRKILRELREADSVHAPIPGDVGTVGMWGAWLCRKPLFVRYCGNWLEPRTAAQRFWRWFMERYAGGRNVMLATGGTPEPPSRKNPAVRWIFSTSLTKRELKASSRARLFPLPGVLRLVHVGRQEPEKGAAIVLRALPMLLGEFPRASLEIIGQGTAITRLKELTQELDLTDRVLFRGNLHHSEVMECLKQADIFCFPTASSEGFPKAVLEALASGLPVVTTRVSVLPQLIGQGAGVLVDDATPEAVAQGVRTAMDSAATYEEMSRKAIATAQQYSLEAWRDTIGGYLEAAWGPLRSEDGRRRTEGGGRRTEDRGRRTEDGGRKTEDGRRKTEDGGRRTEDGRRKTEDGGQRAEDGGRRTEVRSQKTGVNER
jgi:glycosyltransferase involved in cell wall biosynthesis